MHLLKKHSLLFTLRFIFNKNKINIKNNNIKLEKYLLFTTVI